MQEHRALGLIALGAAAFLLAAGLGFGLAPSQPPETVPQPPISNKAVTIIQGAVATKTQPEAPIAPARPIPPAPRPEEKKPVDPQTAEGEVLGGLQIVVHVDKVLLEPGESLHVTWKIVNHLDTPVQYLDVKPGIVIEKDGWRGAYIAAGKNRPASPDDLKQIGPNGTMEYERSIEWPKTLPNQPDDWPDYGKPGAYKLSVGFKDDASIPMVAEQLLKEKNLHVYQQPLASGTVKITVKGEVSKTDVQKTTDPLNEEF